MDRFLRYTTQKEPALTASFLAAVLLAIAARYLGLTDEDLAILGPVMLIVAGVVIRAGVFAPGHGPRPARRRGAGRAVTAHPCPGCLRVTSRPGRCVACGGGTTTQRGYGADWQRRRARQLLRHPACEWTRARTPDRAVVPRPTSTTSCRRSTAGATRRRTSRRCALGTIGSRRRRRTAGGDSRAPEAGGQRCRSRRTPRAAHARAVIVNGSVGSAARHRARRASRRARQGWPRTRQQDRRRG